jgi:lipopolysaccharide export system protein LptA
MTRARERNPAIALIIAALACAPALAANAAKTPATSKTPAASSSPLLPGGNSKEPISIDADKLNYFDKEQKAVYSGNVTVTQGDSKMTCAVMTIFLAKTETPAAGAPGNAATPPAAANGAQAPADAGPTPGGSQVKHMDAMGPVTLVSKTQVATGDRASYDKADNKVWLFGNVTMSDGGNVIKGDQLTYDLTSGEATIDPGKRGPRVTSIIDQSSGSVGDANKTTGAKKDSTTPAPSASAKPKPAKKATLGDANPKP